MKNLKIYFFILNLSIIFVLFFPLISYAQEIDVCSNCKFISVSKALDYSSDGDRILVNKGIYREGNLVITKAIELIGKNAVLDGESKYQVLTIKSNNVKISGFTIKNSGKSFMEDYAGIRLLSVNNCIIKNNIILNSYFGIFLSDSENCKVISNKVVGEAVSEVSYANAIHIWKSRNITVENNELSRHRDGIYFEFVKDSKIFGNYSHNNIRYGLHFMFSDGNSYKKNTFSKNGAGVAVMYTKNIEMIDNNFKNNWGPSAYGLLLKEISHSRIFNNTFTGNTIGIHIETSSKLKIHNNNFNENGWGLRITSSCYNNNIFDNNFTGNSFDVGSNFTDNSNKTNIIVRNYWDKYKGYDLNRDNIGDVPYRPVSLFSIIVEKMPHAIILLRSLLVDILDVSEKVMPVITPKSFIDEKPRIIRIDNDNN